jgi:NAD(P)-dependent dehydrogenase (short-subunit alcohol dehydrogenase family)
LVTGAGGRVGAAIAVALGAEGMNVAVHYHRSGQGAEETAERIRAVGGTASLHQADLHDADACRALVAEVLEAGDLDLLVPSAANFERISMEEVDDGHLSRALTLDAVAPLVLSIAAAESLRRTQGAIVFITDAALERPHTDYLPYFAAKGAVRQVMRALSVELAPFVRVNAVAPGTVLPPASMNEAAIAALISKIPLGRVGRPEDVADAVVALARAELVTGQELVVDGGHRLGA